MDSRELLLVSHLYSIQKNGGWLKMTGSDGAQHQRTRDDNQNMST
jgi:hypothetical protein